MLFVVRTTNSPGIRARITLSAADGSLLEDSKEPAINELRTLIKDDEFKVNLLFVAVVVVEVKNSMDELDNIHWISKLFSIHPESINEKVSGPSTLITSLDLESLGSEVSRS